ncbi:MAG: PhzF family phenazine biosynthesis protein [Firmicutes bacterium]|nr:PhzF family phenazine biosynthesis protein [Bacillota bacterium]
MGYPIFQVDAFTDKPFAGNPAAVCLLLNGEKSSWWMQQVAMEMNLSETAFLVPQADGWKLRWFTPTVEVDLCGHATLASAHVLFSQGLAQAREAIRFYTASGVLTARLREDWLELDFPAEPAWAEEINPEIIGALGVKPLFTGRNRIDYLVEVASEEEVLALKPDMARLRELTERGVMVTATTSRKGYDFVSRFFAPGAGIDEDPVTGSAHCCLGPYWQPKLNKQQFLAWQASSRGGTVKVCLQEDRVILGGQAVMVFQGELLEADF